MRSAPGVWYTGGYYEKIYLLENQGYIPYSYF
jgi:hypothetical protein